MIASTMERSGNSAESTLWEAVLTRDARATFVYGVRSTGVYCRPACPSRRPQPRGVKFFASPRSAEEAGFRACRRCRPEDVPVDPRVGLVLAACRAIEENPRAELTLAALGERIGTSPWHLQRTFKSLVGITPHQYAEACRIERFKAQVREGESITGALYEAGYGSSSRLYERTSSELGMTPSRYRRGGEGKRIRYTIVDSRLGRLLVGATEEGVCAISLGDSDEQLEAILRSEYRAAQIEHDDETLGEWAGTLVRHLDGREPHLDLPIDVRATAFQRRVWEALQAIPYGSTKTYREIARELGDPNGARAVAGACAANPVAIVVPCHRVVREDGGLGGYRWGIERKNELLAREAGSRGDTEDRSDGSAEADQHDQYA
jgi:AraC family transcriptional regulator, regulatory protein of adaptative response / methylated-DNA-[protein]-cysteine methyltransferase